MGKFRPAKERKREPIRDPRTLPRSVTLTFQPSANSILVQRNGVAACWLHNVHGAWKIDLISPRPSSGSMGQQNGLQAAIDKQLAPSPPDGSDSPHMCPWADLDGRVTYRLAGALQALINADPRITSRDATAEAQWLTERFACSPARGAAPALSTGTGTGPAAYPAHQDQGASTHV